MKLKNNKKKKRNMKILFNEKLFAFSKKETTIELNEII